MIKNDQYKILEVTPDNHFSFLIFYNHHTQHSTTPVEFEPSNPSKRAQNEALDRAATFSLRHQKLHINAKRMIKRR